MVKNKPKTIIFYYFHSKTGWCPPPPPWFNPLCIGWGMGKLEIFVGQKLEGKKGLKVEKMGGNSQKWEHNYQKCPKNGNFHFFPPKNLKTKYLVGGGDAHPCILFKIVKVPWMLSFRISVWATLNKQYVSKPIWATFPHTGLNLCVPPLKCDPKYVYDLKG